MRAPPRARSTANWPGPQSARSASRTAPTATSRSPPTPSRSASRPPLPVGAQERPGRHRRTPMGNPDCHVILRGGKAPDYDAASVLLLPSDLEASPAACHADRRLQPRQQQQAARKAKGRGPRSLPGRLRAARAACSPDDREPPRRRCAESAPGKDQPSALEYGKSITDACLGLG